MASFGLKVIRGVFGAAERLVPGLGGRAAFELFCRTPNVKRMTEGERRAVDRASAFMAEARHHRIKTRIGCVAVHEFRPMHGRPLGTVLVIHGWRSRTEFMRSLIEGYRDAGYRVVSLDLPGHGRSLGRRLTMVSAVEAATEVGQWFGPFVGVLGHSFGGAVAVNAAAGSISGAQPLQTRSLILVAAPASMPDIFSDFSRHLNVGRRGQETMARQVKRISGKDLSLFVGDRMLAATPLPTLVVHAHDDREVSASHAELHASAGAHVTLHWADGLGHRRILNDPAVVRKCVSFVSELLHPAVMH